MRLSFRKHRRIVLFVTSSVALVLLLVVFQQAVPVVRTINGVRSGLAWAGNGIGLVIDHVFYSKTKLLEENAALQSEVQAFAINQVEHQTLIEENASLKALLGYTDKAPIAPIIAKVVSRTSEEEGEAILLDRGSTDGVNVGDALVADNGMYVGEITVVHLTTSIARLLTDGTNKVGVRALDSDGTIGIAEGQDGILLKITFIPQSIELNVNDLIVTSGLDPQIPSGLPVGSIKSIQQDEHDAFQQALIEPLIDVRRLNFVGILHLSSL